MRKGDYRLTERQIAFIKENMNTMKRIDIAKRLGISQGTMYAHIKRLGGSVQSYCAVNSEVKDIVLKYYPVMTPSELVERFGHAKSTYFHYASALGVKRTEECQKRMDAERKERVLKVNPMIIDHDAFCRKMRLVRRMDELRVSSGQPQKTRLKLRQFPKNIYKVRWRLLNKKDYIEIIGEPYNFAYDGETKRANEALYEKKYGFRFFDINDIEIEDD